LLKVLRSKFLNLGEKYLALRKIGIITNIKILLYNFDPDEYPPIEVIERELKPRLRSFYAEEIKRNLGYLYEKLEGGKR
jgi:hypothetical protein